MITGEMTSQHVEPQLRRLSFQLRQSSAPSWRRHSRAPESRLYLGSGAA